MDFDADALPIPSLGLRCRHCAYLLDQLPEHRCPECGWRFAIDDLLPPGDFPLVSMDGAPVLLTADVAGILRSARILHISYNGPIESVYGLPTPINGRQWFRVARSDYLYLIHMLRNRDQLPAPQVTGPDWTCMNCPETNPGTFTVCWSCGAERLPPDDNHKV